MLMRPDTSRVKRKVSIHRITLVVSSLDRGVRKYYPIGLPQPATKPFDCCLYCLLTWREGHARATLSFVEKPFERIPTHGHFARLRCLSTISTCGDVSARRVRPMGYGRGSAGMEGGYARGNVPIWGPFSPIHPPAPPAAPKRGFQA